MLTITHRNLKIFLAACAVAVSLGGVTWAGQKACGEEQTVCGAEERCCEHRIATFCENQGCAAVRVEGQCLPKSESCGDFWCGNRQCQTGWLLSRNVCCVYYPSGTSPEYSCTASEFSCPGNSTQMTIRPPTVAFRKLQGE